MVDFCLSIVACFNFVDIGTEEILRGLIPHETTYPLPTSWKPLTYFTYKPWVDEHDMERVFFSSIHLYDGDSFYPGSGEGPSGDSPQLEKNSNIINIALDQIGPSHLEGREKLSQKQRKAFMVRLPTAILFLVTNTRSLRPMHSGPRLSNICFHL